MKDKSTLMNPFPGLRSFRSDEDYLFFGREEQTLELVQRLQRNRFIAVVGSSGRGKSSLVRCGLISRLQGGGMTPAGAHWEIAVMHPGGDPLRHLAEALLECGLYDREEEDALQQLLATLGRSQFGLVEAVRQAKLPIRQASRQARGLEFDGSLGREPVEPAQGGPPATNLLLVVDQFEEIFRYDEAGKAESELANDFIAMLREATTQTAVPIYVVATMRSDFIGDCSRFEGLAEAVNRGEYLVPRLSREQFKSAIEGPIRVAGGQIAPRLLQRLLNDVGEEQDQLPCLQHALMRTWRVWQGRDGAAAVDLEDYAQVGKMSQALSVHADEIYHGFASDRQRELCAAMFKALTVEGSEKRGIRRPRRLQTLCRILGVEKSELLPVIDAFRHPDVSFLMPPTPVELRDSTVIDLSHESLMRVWTRLRDWVDEEAKSVGIFRRLSESAALWREGKTGLIRDPELSIARAWADATRPNATWAAQYEGNFDEAMAYLRASVDAAEAESRRARRRQRILTGTLAAAVVALCIAGVIGLQARKREFQRMSRADVATASRALDEDRVADGLAYLLRAAQRDDHNPEIAPQLVSVLTSRKFQMPEAAPLNLGSRIRSVRFSDDESKITAFADDGTIAVIDRATHRVTTTKLPSPLAGSFGGILGTGRIRVATCRDSILRFVDGDTGQVVKEIELGKKVLAAWVVNEKDPVAIVLMEGGSMVACRNRADSPVTRLITRESNTWFNFSDDGRWFYSAAGDSTRITVWNALTGERVSEVVTPLALAYFLPNADGSRMVVALRRDNRVLWQVYSLPGGEPLNEATQPISNTEARTTVFDAAGRRLFVRSPQSVQVYDAGTVQPVGPAINGQFTGAWFTPDGERLFINADAGARMYDIASGRPTTPVLAHDGNPRHVNFTEDGARLLTTTLDGSARVWDARTGELLGEPTTKVPDVVAVVSKDGQHLVLGSSHGRVYRMRVSRGAAQPLVLPRNELPAAFRSETAAEYYRLTGDQLRFIDIASGRESSPAVTLPAKLTSASHTLARGNANAFVVYRGGDKWESWRIADGKVVAVPLEPGAPLTTLRVFDAALGQRVALSYDQRVRVWDATTGKPVGPEILFNAPVRHTQLYDGGRRAVVGTVIGGVFMTDVETGKVLRELKGLREDVDISAVRIRETTGRVAAANRWGEVQVWDAATGEPVSTLMNHDGTATLQGFSPDGAHLLTHAYRTATLWTVTGQVAGPPLVHRTRVLGAAFGRGTRVVTTADNSIRVWDSVTGRPVCEPMVVPGVRFTSPAVSSDGRFVRAVGRSTSSTAQHDYFFSLPPAAGPGARVPDWLLDLALVCASRTVDADERFTDAPDAVDKLEAARRQLAALPPDAPYAEWGRWFLSEDSERPIAPGFSITPAQARRIAEEMDATSKPVAAAAAGGR